MFHFPKVCFCGSNSYVTTMGSIGSSSPPLLFTFLFFLKQHLSLILAVWYFSRLRIPSEFHQLFGKSWRKWPPRLHFILSSFLQGSDYVLLQRGMLPTTSCAVLKAPIGSPTTLTFPLAATECFSVQGGL